MSINRASTGEETRDAPAATKIDIPALYQRYHATLHIYARRFLPPHRHDDANDAMMTVFRRLNTQRENGTLKEQPNWEAYLKLAVKNACLDIIKTDREHLELDPEDPQIHRHAPVDPTGDSVVETMSQREKFARAAAALNSLDKTDTRLRIIVLGKLFEERTEKDIGAQLNITGPRVGQLYRKALKMLQEEVNRTNDQ